MTIADQLLGEEVDGYRILGVLGKGGMGVVFKAEDVSLGRLVAIKLIDPKFADEDEYLRRFRREAQALARLRSPNIVMVHALRRTRFGLFIVMEFVDGVSLSEHFDGEHFGEAAVSWKRVVPILRQVLSALAHAHSLGVVHRDIKPSNIMLTEAGEVRVMDFGIAKLLENDPAATVTQGVSGTPYYMSPEQVVGQQVIDGRTDLYSLAMTAYHLLAGRLPFDEDSNLYKIFQHVMETDIPPLQSIRADIPYGVSAVIEKALRKPRAERFQSAAEMLAALDEADSTHRFDRAAATITATATEILPETRATDLIHDSRILRYAALLLVGLGALGWGLWAWRGDRERTNPIQNAGMVAGSGGVINERDSVGAGEQPDAPGEGGITDSLAEPPPETEEVAPIEASGSEESATPSGSVSVRSEPAGARVRIDGRDYGRTPTRVSLPEGRHQLVLERDGHEPYRTSFQVVASRTFELAPDLVPSTADLRVIVRPWGNVYIDGALRQEQVSSAQTFELPVGSHTVSVRNPVLGRWERSVNVVASEGARVEVDFTIEIPVTITSFGPNGQPRRGPIFVDGVTMEKWSPATVPLRVGLHRIEVRAPGYEQDGGPRTINIESSSGPQSVRLTLSPLSR